MTNNTEPCWEPGKILHQILQCFFSLNLQDFDQFFCVVPKSLRLDLAQFFFCLGVSESLRQTQYWFLYFGLEWNNKFVSVQKRISKQYMDYIYNPFINLVFFSRLQIICRVTFEDFVNGLNITCAWKKFFISRIKALQKIWNVQETI